MTALSLADRAAIRAELVRVMQLRADLARWQAYAKQIKTIAFDNDMRRAAVTVLHDAPERLAGACELYQRTDYVTRAALVQNYKNKLDELSNPSGPLYKLAQIDFNALPLPARPYWLTPYLNLLVGHEFPRLDFSRSQPSRGVLTYTHARGPADLDQWRSLLPKIAAWLGGHWVIGAADATTITLRCQPPLPETIPMQQAWLRRDALFTGIDTETQQPTYLPFRELTAGTLVVGTTGSGKSNATHLLLHAVLVNQHLFQAVFCIDGKEGVTFARYQHAAPDKLRVLYDEPEVWALAGQLVNVMRARNAKLRTLGLDQAPGDYIAVFIEEMSTYTARPSHVSNSPKNKAHAQFLDDLAMLARRGRSAGLRLLITAQDPTDNQVPTTVRSNCPTVISFRLPVDAHATMLFGQLDPTRDPRRLKRGQALVKRDDGTVRQVQFPLSPTEGPRP